MRVVGRGEQGWPIEGEILEFIRLRRVTAAMPDMNDDHIIPSNVVVDEK